MPGGLPAEAGFPLGGGARRVLGGRRGGAAGRWRGPPLPSPYWCPGDAAGDALAAGIHNVSGCFTLSHEQLQHLIDRHSRASPSAQSAQLDAFPFS